MGNDKSLNLVSKLRRPTLIILGLGQAGQEILYNLEVLAKKMELIDIGKTGAEEKLAIWPREIGNILVSVIKSIRVEEHKGLSGYLRELQPTDYIRVRGRKERGEVVELPIPVVSERYGISMLRLDLDTRTLEEIGSRILEQGLPVPPGIGIRNTPTTVKDPVLGDEETLNPGNGSGGRSGAVYQLLIENEESKIVLDYLGIPTKYEVETLGTLVTAIPSYHSFLIIYGLVGSGAGISSAILERLKEVANAEILRFRFKMLLSIVPSALEAHSDKPITVKYGIKGWTRVVQWDINRLLDFMSKGVVDTAFIVDLDLAKMQYNKNEHISYETLRETNKFIARMLDGDMNLYKYDKLKEATKFSADSLYTDYEKIDWMIAASLEPILLIHGPRGIRFGVGGSSVDESEIKDLLGGFTAIPMIVTRDVFKKYLDMARKSREEDITGIIEEAIAALVVPLVHGIMAAVTRKVVEGLIVVVSREALRMIKDRLGYVPSARDLEVELGKIFTRCRWVRVMVAYGMQDASIVGYALADPRTYLKEILLRKGWA